MADGDVSSKTNHRCKEIAEKYRDEYQAGKLKSAINDMLKGGCPIDIELDGQPLNNNLRLPSPSSVPMDARAR